MERFRPIMMTTLAALMGAIPIALEVEHQAVGVRHDGHVTRVSASGAEKTDDFVFPRASGELDHVLGCRWCSFQAH